MATQYTTCPNCHTQNTSLNRMCTNCGTTMPIAPMPMQPAAGYGAQTKPPGADKKILAGILGIVLGGLGIHKFVLGYQQEGIILLGAYVISIIIAVVTCGIGTPLILVPSVIGLIEGIMYLTKSDEEFVQTYIVNKRPWF
jgi:TM2 domain-containing membrane protein YozV